jgi:phosphoglycerate dehydrogenase-like enzyme
MLRGMVAMYPTVVDEVLPADLRLRLSRHVLIEPADAVTDWRAPAARAALRDADVLITGWGAPMVDAPVLAAAPRLAAVFHAGGTVKAHLDDAVWHRGIQVSSAADAGAEPVVDYTVAAITLAGKRAVPLARRYAAGHFATRAERAGGGNDGRVVGVVGASRIGRGVIGRLVAAGRPVLVADPYLSTADAAGLGAELADLDELCRRCTVVTLHAPDLPETRHLIDERRLALLADGAILINTARGALVDTDALTAACTAGRVDAVLDVTDPEPLPAGHPLFTLPNVLITPHLAGVQGSEVRRLGEFAIAELERYLRGEALRGLVRHEDLAILA